MKVLIENKNHDVYFQYATLRTREMTGKRSRPLRGGRSTGAGTVGRSARNGSLEVPPLVGVTCIIRPEASDRDRPWPVRGRGLAIPKEGSGFDRRALRKEALRAALEDARFDRKQRAEVWDVYRRSCSWRKLSLAERLRRELQAYAVVVRYLEPATRHRLENARRRLLGQTVIADPEQIISQEEKDDEKALESAEMS